MSYLTKAQNRHAFLKMGIYGDAGSGKTTTAALTAIGLHQYAKLKKPVAMFDTEPAASFLIPRFEKACIDFYVYDQSRAMDDLMGWAAEVEQNCSIVIIDSITHVWRELQTTFLHQINEKRKRQNKSPVASLEFQDWGPIKDRFGKFTNWFLSSKVHVIVCGRQGGIYQYQKNDKTGKMELITIGDKMATEKEMGYEPSLLVSMDKVIDSENGGIINMAFVEKDRAAMINGKEFQFPGFDHFLPHIKALNIGGDHFGSMDDRKSAFGNYSDGDWDFEKRQREIWQDEIKEVIAKKWASQSADDKKARMDAIEKHFGSRSWQYVETLKSDDLRERYLKLRDDLEEGWRSTYSGDARHITDAIKQFKNCRHGVDKNGEGNE